MEKIKLQSRHGYEIVCTSTLEPGQRKAVIVLHGFGSSQESPAAMLLHERLPKRGMGAISFDFPGHGYSTVDTDHLLVEECVDLAEDVTQWVRARFPETEIQYFASSFGAYICLHYLATRAKTVSRALLRSPAVNMSHLFEYLPGADAIRQALEKDGYYMMPRGMLKPMKLPRAFFEDLARHDAFQVWKKGLMPLHIVMGTADEVVGPADMRRFSELFDVPRTEIEGGDHSLSRPGMPAQMLQAALEFLDGEEK